MFVDSSAYYAVSAERDANHRTAQAMLTSLVRRNATMFTTRYILAEAHALVINRLRNTRGGADLLRRIEASANTTIVPVTDSDEARARVIIERYDDHLFTLTDAINFAVMERPGLTYAFSFDSDFAAFGFTALAFDLLR
ncbi:MAG TPA: PIN domain-containing protein [Dehalococcoidia bacterium]|nr:PIN domain-containing protein [Dehalococcoidia bacterium]